jgi:AraC-like DNA-binding protein
VYNVQLKPFINFCVFNTVKGMVDKLKSNFFLDINEDSSSMIHTPSLISQKLPFYLHNCGHFFAGKDYFTEREGLDNYLLVYTVSGSGLLSYRGQEFSLVSNQAFLINCSEHHIYQTAPCGFWEIKWLHFNGSACQSYFDMINNDLLNVITFIDSSEIIRFMDEIPQLIIKNDRFNDIKISMFITNILTELVLNKITPVSSNKFSEHNLMVEKAISFIHKNYTNKINMSDLTKLVHTSEYHFIRVFKKYTNVSPYEYLINFRINKSKSLLKETDLTINEISNRTGFNNINNYIRDFKKLVGTTPLKYRNFWIS